MTGGHFSLILLPTLACNADCDYCFEIKSERNLTLDQLSSMIHKVVDHMEANQIDELSIYWQGGEVMTLPPAWFERAHGIINEISQVRNKQISNYLQSNMISYSEKWNRVLAEMFDNSVGSSMDFPNLHRKLKGGCGAQEYEEIWTRNIKEAVKAGIHVGVISIANEQTFELGAERFYSYFVDELGISDFQINTPFPGGPINDVKKGFPSEMDRLSQFLVDLADIWMKRGFQRGVKLGPFDSLMDYFLHGNKNLLCIWRENCAEEFVCIDPMGNVAQCDCWVTSYPEFRYGRVFDPGSLSDLMGKSEIRRNFRQRPGLLMQKEDCIECDYLHLCHGGCPVRTYAFFGDLFRKDPYCRLYKQLFQTIEANAMNHLRLQSAEGGHGKDQSLVQPPQVQKADHHCDEHRH